MHIIINCIFPTIGILYTIYIIIYYNITVILHVCNELVYVYYKLCNKTTFLQFNFRVTHEFFLNFFLVYRSIRVNQLAFYCSILICSIILYEKLKFNIKKDIFFKTIKNHAWVEHASWRIHGCPYGGYFPLFEELYKINNFHKSRFIIWDSYIRVQLV